MFVKALGEDMNVGYHVTLQLAAIVVYDENVDNFPHIQLSFSSSKSMDR
jgi:hypothetical protein